MSILCFLSISIHAPRVGSDPARFCLSPFDRISIHAPRVGSDTDKMGDFSQKMYFNPRSPCGERPPIQEDSQKTSQFQSTLPVWGATSALFRIVASAAISIHAPRVGSDDASVGVGRSQWGISIHAPRVGSDF